MRAYLLAAATLALAACQSHNEGDAAMSAFPDDATIRAILETRVDEGRAKGLVVGLLEADGSRRIVVHGEAGDGARPLSRDSVYEIGSITKAFNGVLLAAMHARGEVDMTAPAQACAPDGLTIPSRNGKAITLELLASHMSGLPRLPGNMQPADMENPYADYTAEQMKAFLNTHELTRDPGAAYEYSNLGAGLLGHLLAHCAGMDYGALMRERILDPLGMTMTGIALSPQMREQLAPGHDLTRGAAPGWDFQVLAPAGALRSNVADMLTFLEANTGDARNDLERAMRESHRSRGSEGAEGVALGWHINQANGHTIVWHNGGTGGYRTYAGFDPARRIGVVVLNNSTGSPDDIAMHLIAGTPLAPPPAPPVERAEIALAPEEMEKFAGEYSLDSAPGFRFVFTVEDGVLMLTPSGQDKSPVHPESPVKFFSRVVDAQIEFVMDDGGAVTGLLLHQGGQHPATRVN